MNFQQSFLIQCHMILMIIISLCWFVAQETFYLFIYFSYCSKQLYCILFCEKCDKKKSGFFWWLESWIICHNRVKQLLWTFEVDFTVNPKIWQIMFLKFLSKWMIFIFKSDNVNIMLKIVPMRDHLIPSSIRLFFFKMHGITVEQVYKGLQRGRLILEVIGDEEESERCLLLFYHHMRAGLSTNTDWCLMRQKIHVLCC